MAFLNDSVLGSMFTRYKTPAYVNLDLRPTFTPALLLKDFRLGADAARELGVPLPVAAAAQEIVQRLVDSGYDDVDFDILWRIVSDDLSLVLPRDGALDLVGSPFRGTYEGGEPVVGSFPLAAGFRLVQAEEAEVRPVPRVRGFAELVGNLPFVAEAYHRDPALLESVERAFARVPLAHLHFRPDDSYWDAIARAGL